MSRLRELSSWIAFLYLLGLFLTFLTFILDLAGLEELRRLAAQPWRPILLYILATLTFFISLHFLRSALRIRRLRRMIKQKGHEGPVLVSPQVLRRLIKDSLSERGPKGAKVRFVPGRRGLRITVELSRVEPKLLRTAEEVQRLLRQRVEVEAGIKVERIEVRARSLLKREDAGGRGRESKALKPKPKLKPEPELGERPSPASASASESEEPGHGRSAPGGRD